MLSQAQVYGIFLAIGLILAPVARGDDRPAPPIEVYDWSVWVGSPAQNSLNAPRVYRNALPWSVGTSRPKAEEPELSRKFPIAPISVVQTFGDPVQDIDYDLRIKKGTVIAHWPPGAERSGGIRWFKSNILDTLPAGLNLANLPDDHWFQKLRQANPSRYVKYETRAERFLAYDAELNVPIPIKIRGGPDEYTLQNLTSGKLLDVAVIAPVEGGGYRVGWLDGLPSAVPKDVAAEEKEKAKEKEKEKDKDKDKPETRAKAAEKVFEEVEAEAKTKDKDKKDEPKPIPAEGDADIKARVDQALNRQVTVNVDKVPRREVLALVTAQARIRFELDDPTITKAEVDLNLPMTLKAGQIAARDALADVLGTVGLSYRVTDEAQLFITTAARLTAESAKKAIIEGPPVKLTLGPAMKPTESSYKEVTRDAYSRRLAAQGMRPEVIQTFLDQYANAFFEPKGLIVLAHLSRESIEEVVILDVFPAPKKLYRMAVVVSHGVDPRLQDQARVLIKQLGDNAAKAREVAEAQLFEMGPVAVPVLEDALRDKDIEIVFRAERLLLRLNRQVP